MENVVPDVSSLSWYQLLTYLKSKKGPSEAQCLQLIQHELANKKRRSFVARLYGRFAQMRSDRERQALNKKNVVPKLPTEV